MEEDLASSKTANSVESSENNLSYMTIKNKNVKKKNSLNCFQNNNNFYLSDKKLKLINNLNNLLKKIIKMNKPIIEKKYENNKKINENSHKFSNKTSFDMTELPDFELKDYLLRVISLCKISSESLIISLIYLEKYLNNTSKFLSEYNVFLLMLISIIISLKMNEDYIVSTKLFSIIGLVNDFNLIVELEFEFLLAINFDLYVKDKLYNKYSKPLTNI